MSTKVVTGKNVEFKINGSKVFYVTADGYGRVLGVDPELERMLKEVPYKMLFKIKCVSSRKGSGKKKKNQYNLIRLRDGFILKKNVRGRGKLENYIKRKYKEEYEAHQRNIEKILLG